MLDQHLITSTPTTRRLKTALEVAKLVGFFDISLMKREDENRLLFEVALIVLLSLKPDVVACPYPSIAVLLASYPEFESCEEDERIKLMYFANYMKYAQALLPPKQKKAHLLDMVTRRTEGSTKKYVCGGGQTAATGRRVLIYEREGGTSLYYGIQCSYTMESLSWLEP